MKFNRNLVLFFFLLVSNIFAQSSREDAWREIENLRQQIKEREKILLSVSDEDLAAYKSFLEQENTGIIRLLPRGMYDGKLTIRGGGAYYSFARKTHEYGFGSDIWLDMNDFSVGFAGSDFGVFKDLGKVPIENLSLESEGIKELAQFDSPLDPNVNMNRIINPTPQNSRIAAETGKTYALRSINVKRSDIIVVFRVLSEDIDGSFVIVWKILKSYTFENAIEEKILTEYRKKGFTDISVKTEKGLIVLRGTVPKGRMAEAVQTAQEANNGKPVLNQLTEK